MHPMMKKRLTKKPVKNLENVELSPPDLRRIPESENLVGYNPDGEDIASYSHPENVRLPLEFNF